MLKHKMGTLKGPLATAREVAKKAQEAGGGIEETKSADELEGEAQRVQDAINVMEGQRLSLESEAFVKATAQKPARASPF